jgi:hypothetical protein
MVREAMLARFDANDDGQLNEVERAAAMAWRAENGDSMPRRGFRPGTPRNRPDDFRPRPDSTGDAPVGRPEGRGRGGRGRPEAAVAPTAALNRAMVDVASSLDRSITNYISEIENAAWEQDTSSPVIFVGYMNVPATVSEDLNSFASVYENTDWESVFNVSAPIGALLSVPDLDYAALDAFLLTLQDEIWGR